MAGDTRVVYVLGRAFKRLVTGRKSCHACHRCCYSSGWNEEGQKRDRAPRLGRDVDASTPAGAYTCFSWLSQYGPAFPISGQKVIVLSEPLEFFEILKVKTRKAKERISIASLYLGTGHLEAELVDCLDQACERARHENKDFEVNVLLDITRGSRGGAVSSRGMLLPLLRKYWPHMNVALYHTPDLRGLMRHIMPQRYNETIGLTHLKVYLFDNSVIISGANLSNDYFTNRQDRYILLNDCEDVADFFHELVRTVSSFSMQLQTDNTVKMPDETPGALHPYRGFDRGAKFKSEARERVEDLLSDFSGKERSFGGERDLPALVRASHQAETNASDGAAPPDDTWVFPLLQMGALGINHDERATLHLMRAASARDEILLASGYFNLTDAYRETILRHSAARYKILLAAPEVNGFFGAKGPAGKIPLAYIHVAKQFYERLHLFNQAQRVQLFEYLRERWTFHAKGLWYYLPGQELPSLTLIGSPNFGYRSVYRDLECQVAIVTGNPQLRAQLREEHVRLFQSSSQITPETFKRADRHVPLWAKLVTNIIKTFF